MKEKNTNIVFLNNSFNSLCRKAVKRNLLSNTDYSSFYKIKYGEDLLQSLEIFKAAKRTLFLPDHLYNYRVNPTSITHTIEPKKYRVDFTVREKVLEFLQSEDVWQESDYINYWQYCVSLLVAEILMIANFDTNFKIIKAFFDEMAKTEYFLDFLSSKRYKNVKKRLSKKGIFVWFLFNKKYYWLLFFIFKVRSKIKNTIKFINK